MSLGQHLLELRKRLFLAAAGIFVGAVIGWFLSDLVWNALREPIYTIAIATLLFGEVLAPVQLLGGAFVVGGVLLAETGRRQGKAKLARSTDRPDAQARGGAASGGG